MHTLDLLLEGIAPLLAMGNVIASSRVTEGDANSLLLHSAGVLSFEGERLSMYDARLERVELLLGVSVVNA